MIKIVVGDLYSTVLDAKNNLEGLAIIRKVCRARPSGYQYMAMYKIGRWDGYVSMMHTFSTFPTGLLSLAIDALKEAGVVNIELLKSDVATPSNTLTKNILKDIELRDYQLDAVTKLVTNTRGVAKMATNSGKTEVMAAVIKYIGCKAIVLVHRKELMYQTAERFTQRGIENVGMCGDGLWQPNVVTVAMIQTLSNHEDLSVFDGNTILFCDETHHLSGAQAQEIYYKLPGKYRFGVSGTPLKHDVLSDMKLIAATGPVVCEVTNEYMIANGFSAKPKVDIVIIEGNKDEWNMDYHSAYDALIVNNKARNKIIAKYAKSINGAVLILVTRIEHGNILAKLTKGTFLSGSDAVEDRKAALETMRAGKGIFIASPIFDEGVDVPGVHAVILAGGGKSQVKLLQRIGRGLRHKEDESDLKVLDFIDDTNKHLLKHSNDRIETYVAEGFETVVN